MMFAVFWIVMTSHCQIEMLAGVEFLRCVPSSESPAFPSHCGDDVCSIIESGLYTPGIDPVTAPMPLLVQAVDEAGLLESPLPERTSLIVPLLSESAAPPRPWQFIHRSACPPRAPSFVV
jgi:hypothetical protein